jgi:hypothetical protein
MLGISARIGNRESLFVSQGHGCGKWAVSLLAERLILLRAEGLKTGTKIAKHPSTGDRIAFALAGIG